MDCGKCGRDHVRDGKRTCYAHRRTTVPVAPCMNFPTKDFPICRFHGGNASQITRLGQQRNIETAMLAAVDKYIATHPRPHLIW
jgi:hypothetical protein